MSAPTVLHVAAGPDAGSSFALEPGRWLVGRARGCAVRLDDPAVEAHHALLVVDGDGVGVLQLTGRCPVLVDGAPVHLAPIPGDSSPVVTSPVVVGRSIELGHDLLRLGAAPAPPERRAELGVGGDGDCVGFDLRRRPVEVIAVVVDPAIDPGLAMAGAVVRRLVAQLARADDRTLIVTGSPDDVPTAGHLDGVEAVTVVAILQCDSPVLDRCTARLDLGTRWRGRWTPATHRPLRIERVHLAGCPGSADAVGPFVAQQIARALAEAGRSILGVPQPA